ncbi:carbohydrate ABC transporter permease [Cutibacterium acnes]|uniref:carbohydrate ABC transporter permease n=1 Tax=Cutibacterium acnes TaxID=1747 RepID=UPI0039E8D0BD
MSEQNLMESTDHGTTGVVPPVKRNRGKGGKPQFGLTGASMLVVMIIAALYFLAPLWWFLVSATKSNGGLYSGNPFWFHDFSLAENFTDIVHRDGGIYFRWLRNSIFYSLVAGVGAGLISAMAGYALAKFRFRGRDAVFNCVLAATLLPIMLLTVPLYLMFSKVGLVDTIWAMILPSLINPFGIYLCRVYSATVPTEVLEAARLDGTSEAGIFFKIVLRIISPALATVFLIQFVSTWANFLLPTMMLTTPEKQPLAVGLVTWQATIQTGNPAPTNILIFGAFLSVLPLVALFLLLQRYWKTSLTTGGIK